MDKPLNGAPVRTGVHPAPGRESLLNKITELQAEIGQLQEAIVSHAVIDHAIGVVIGLGGLRSDQGFQVLRDVSQHTNIKLRQSPNRSWTGSTTGSCPTRSAPHWNRH
jgi:AmiR/NasT family two-component response regulator